jgi:hypothetical protein
MHEDDYWYSVGNAKWLAELGPEESKIDEDTAPRYSITTDNKTTPHNGQWISSGSKITLNVDWAKLQKEWEEANQTGPYYGSYTTTTTPSKPWFNGRKSVAELRAACDKLYKESMGHVIAIMLDPELTKEEQLHLIGEVAANLYNAIINLDPEFAKQELAQLD